MRKRPREEVQRGVVHQADVVLLAERAAGLFVDEELDGEHGERLGRRLVRDAPRLLAQRVRLHVQSLNRVHLACAIATPNRVLQ